MTTPRPIDDRVRAAMAKAGVDLEQLSQLSGLSQDCLVHYTILGAHPHGADLQALTDALNISPDWLIHGTGSMQPNAV